MARRKKDTNWALVVKHLCLSSHDVHPPALPVHPLPLPLLARHPAHTSAYLNIGLSSRLSLANYLMSGKERYQLVSRHSPRG